MIKDNTNSKICDYSSLLLHIDGGCEPKNPGGVTTSGWVFYDLNEPATPLAENGVVVQDGGPLATNNYGEYMALVLALEWLISQKWQGNLVIKADSKLVIEQVSGRWKVKADHLKPLKAKILKHLETLNLMITDDEIADKYYRSLLSDNYHCSLMWVARDFNAYANDLCRAAYVEYTK